MEPQQPMAMNMMVDINAGQDKAEESSEVSSGKMLHINIVYRGTGYEVNIDGDRPIEDLMKMIEDQTQIPLEYQKLIVQQSGVVSLDKLDKFGGPEAKLKDVFPNETSRKKVMLMGTPLQKMKEMQDTESLKAREEARHLQMMRNLKRFSRKPVRTTQPRSTQYTFGKLEPLPFLPNPEKARAVLQRLADDRGVCAVMEKHQFEVGMLGELDPTLNTDHEKRRLGVNEGMGAVIRLRLRTDDYGGFCNYREVRNVLCHELAHNVHSEHDAKFWALTRQLEREVVELDPFGRKGHQIGEDIYKPPDDNSDMMLCDDGGLVGTTQVLGGSADSSSNPSESLQAKMRRAAERRRRDSEK
jgi:hypothetical protein